MNLKKFFEGEKFFCHMWSALVGGLLGRLGEGLECPSVWFPKAGPPPPHQRVRKQQQSMVLLWPGLLSASEGASWEVLHCTVLQMGTCSPLVQTVIHSDVVTVTHLSLLRLNFLS